MPKPKKTIYDTISEGLKRGQGIEWMEENIKEIQKEKLRYELYQLDWIKILNEAVRARPGSWNKDAVYEWRNASDEVMNAVINALKEKGIVKDPIDELRAKVRGKYIWEKKM